MSHHLLHERYNLEINLKLLTGPVILDYKLPEGVKMGMGHVLGNFEDVNNALQEFGKIHGAAAHTALRDIVQKDFFGTPEEIKKSEEEFKNEINEIVGEGLRAGRITMVA